MRTPRFRLRHSLRYKLIVILSVSTLIPLLLIGSVSYLSIYSILQNKVEKGVKQTLRQEIKGLEEVLTQLDFASKQLAIDGDIGMSFEQYFAAGDIYDKRVYQKEIERSLSLINYTNANLGVMFYYIPEANERLFANWVVDEQTDPTQFPLLGSNNRAVYYGPHRTMHTQSSNVVFSVLRPMDHFLTDEQVYIYIETNFKLFTNLLRSEQYGFSVKHALADESGAIVYSEDDAMQVGQQLLLSENGRTVINDSYVFTDRSEQGWYLATIVQEEDLTGEMKSWLLTILVIGMLTLAVSLFMAWLIWRTVYRPIAVFKSEIKLLGSNQFNRPTRTLQVTEFDDLLSKFYDMRGRIRELLTDVETRERNKRLLEVEKLMHQINPHFLHNTLSTIQWIAKSNGQNEIVRLVSIFTRVLHYNLGKEGSAVRLFEEVEALRDYVALQQIRYNHTFEVTFRIDPETEYVFIPRFLLQPLVENAMYHGFTDRNGTIVVSSCLEADGSHFVIQVADNGGGMSEETIRELFSSRVERKRAGLGIGLSFVNQMIRVYYGEAYRLHVDSVSGEGTRMSMRLPCEMKGGVSHDQSDTRG
jgi:two-component system sensor histidine kinase YesM